MKRYGRYLYEWIFAVPLAIAVLQLCYEDLGLKKAGFGACFYAALFCAACAFLLYLSGKERLIAAGAIAVLLGLPVFYGPLTGGARYYDTHRYIWLIPAVSAICYLAGFLCKRLRAARYLAAAGIITCLVLFLVFDYTITKLCVMLLLSVLLLLIADEIQVFWRKSGYTDHALHLTFVAPFVLFWLLFCLLFPVGKEPYDWHIIRNLFDRIRDFGVSLSQLTGGKADDFDAYLPGFSEDSRVSGSDVSSDDRELLLVQRVMGSSPSVRLGGQVCDTFSDMKWTSTITGDNYEAEFDTLETRCAFEQAGFFTDYLQTLELRITFRRFSSRHLFTPDKVFITGSTLSKMSVTAEGRNLLYEKNHGINHTYLISGYRVNLFNSAFTELMNSLSEITSEDWDRLLFQSDVSATAASYANFLQYRQQVKENYLKPVTLSDATAKWVAEATEGAGTPFERIIKLAQALSGFEYTTSPGRFPDYVTDGTSFLDYFLSSQKGYCTHFATAMTLLARAEGLPARYVHGFSVTFDEDGTASVMGNNAHAWCEIYFENAGWLPFDVTPGFSSDNYWSTGRAQDEQIMKPSSAPTTPVTPAPRSGETGKNGLPFVEILVLALSAIAILFLFTVLVLLSDRIITRYRYKRLSDSERIRVLYRRLNRLLSSLGLGQEDRETLQEFRDRLSGALPSEAVDWISVYERFLYGSLTAPGEVVSVMENAGAALTAALKERKPRLYLLYRLSNRLIH